MVMAMGAKRNRNKTDKSWAMRSTASSALFLLRHVDWALSLRGRDLPRSLYNTRSVLRILYWHGTLREVGLPSPTWNIPILTPSFWKAGSAWQHWKVDCSHLISLAAKARPRAVQGWSWVCSCFCLGLPQRNWLPGLVLVSGSQGPSWTLMSGEDDSNLSGPPVSSQGLHDNYGPN